MLESYAEPLAVFASRLGARYPSGELRYAWKTLLQNHPHDSICGCSIDPVHEENMTRFARARQVAEAVVETALDVIADSVRPAPPGVVRAVAVNPDASSRHQIVDAFIDLPIDSAEPWRVVDAQALDRPVVFWPKAAAISEVASAGGDRVEFQVLDEETTVTHIMSRYETPWALNVRRVHLLWWAPSLPPCGYAAFDLKIGARTGTPEGAPYTNAGEFARPTGTGEGAGSPQQPGVGHRFSGASTGGIETAPYASSYGRRLVTSGERFVENELLRLSLNDDGTFEVTDKATGMTYHRAAALEDGGDVGDEYNYCPPATDRTVTNAQAQVTRAARVAAGPLRATIRVDLELPLPIAAGSDRRHRAADVVAVPVSVEATLDAGSPRVTFAVFVDNHASDHRLRIMFPTGVNRVATARADSAFDVVTRPARVAVPRTIKNESPVSSAPLISLVDAGDAETGATVIATGLMEYEIVGEPSCIALTLIRAVGDLSRNDLATRPSGHAGPPVATPGAQCLGRHRFALAFEPHGPAPPAGALVASARAHTIPPRLVTVRGQSGTADTSRSFLDVDRRAGDVVLSALKQAEDRSSTIVRLFNPGDEEAQAAITVNAELREAFALNFLEERQDGLVVEHDAVSVRLRPRQIQTIELVE
jgi:alpha-mannosidase